MLTGADACRQVPAGQCEPTQIAWVTSCMSCDLRFQPDMGSPQMRGPRAGRCFVPRSLVRRLNTRTTRSQPASAAISAPWWCHDAVGCRRRQTSTATRGTGRSPATRSGAPRKIQGSPPGNFREVRSRCVIPPAMAPARPPSPRLSSSPARPSRPRPWPPPERPPSTRSGGLPVRGCGAGTGLWRGGAGGKLVWSVVSSCCGGAGGAGRGGYGKAEFGGAGVLDGGGAVAVLACPVDVLSSVE